MAVKEQGPDWTKNCTVPKDPREQEPWLSSKALHFHMAQPLPVSASPQTSCYSSRKRLDFSSPSSPSHSFHLIIVSPFSQLSFLILGFALGLYSALYPPLYSFHISSYCYPLRVRFPKSDSRKRAHDWSSLSLFE